MALILNIDTAFEKGTVALSRNGEVIAQEESATQKDHASFLQPAIKQLCNVLTIKLDEIDAVAVSNGPGSYTGLRVGLSSAKGICYALNKPLILVNTLYIIAFGLKQANNLNPKFFYCPMIDARRMEVFTALYNYDLQQVKEFESVIVDENFLKEERNQPFIIAGGNGSFKINHFPGAGNIIVSGFGSIISNLSIISSFLFNQKTFSNIAYSEPFYIKPVYIR